MVHSSEYDVCIMGAGPVGLTLAILLKRQGVEDIIVCDRQPSRYPLPRAVALNHDSRRIMEAAGLKEMLDPLLEDVTVRGEPFVSVLAESVVRRDHPVPTLAGCAG